MENFRGSLNGRTFVVKQARHHGTARTLWCIMERELAANTTPPVFSDWLVLDFLTATEAEKLSGVLKKLGATVIKEERG